MRQALVNLNSDMVQQYPDYVCRVTSNEGDVGLGHLSNFQDLERQSPVILTTSQMLTTGVDAPTWDHHFARVSAEGLVGLGL